MTLGNITLIRCTVMALEQFRKNKAENFDGRRGGGGWAELRVTLLIISRKKKLVSVITNK